MNIVAILASPHGLKGTTGTLLTHVLDAAERADAEITYLSLADLPVQPCQACDTCHRTGRCAQDDHFGEIKSAMLAADGVILASPNYIASVSAQMKALFDRCCGLLHCQALRGKYAAAVESSGGPEGQEVAQYMLRFLQVLGCSTVGSVGATPAELADASRRPDAFDRARDLGASLVHAIRDRKGFPEQTALQDSYFQRMKGLVQAHRTDWPFEYEHWKSQGWL